MLAVAATAAAAVGDISQSSDQSSSAGGIREVTFDWAENAVTITIAARGDTSAYEGAIVLPLREPVSSFDSSGSVGSSPQLQEVESSCVPECQAQSVSIVPPGYQDQVLAVATAVGTAPPNFCSFWKRVRPVLPPGSNAILNQAIVCVQAHASEPSKQNVAQLHRVMFGDGAAVVSRREMRRKKPKGGRG